MKKFRIEKWFIYAVLVVVFLFPVGVAMAVPPVTVTNEFVLEDEWIGECDDFSILAYGEHKNIQYFYFDQDGEVTKILVQYSIINGKVFNSEDPNRYLPEGPDHFMFFVDPDSGDLTQSGLALTVTVPGYGVIAINAGRVIFNFDPDLNVLWDAGQNDVFTGDLDALCAYLSAP